MSKTTTHQTLWFSARGFANEGIYIYGSTSEIRGIIIDSSSDAETTIMSNHLSIDAAKKMAHTLAQKDKKNYTYSEICCIDSMSAFAFKND